MERVTICSSLKHKELIRSTISKLQAIGIIGLFPNLDSGIKKEGVDLELMRSIETDHFAAIDSSEGIYVLCPDGQIGLLVSAEIGYTKAQGKSIVFSQEPEDLGLQALATDYISLENLRKIRDV